MDLKQPLVATGNEDKFDVEAKVTGGGASGQTGAIRLGIARALLEYDAANEGNEDSYRAILKKAGLITRDPRAKERKKPGLKAARRAPQFSKRQYLHITKDHTCGLFCDIIKYRGVI